MPLMPAAITMPSDAATVLIPPTANSLIIESGGEPVVFESDCREGVCGACGFLVNGVPHGPLDTTPACRQHLRAFPGVTRFRLEPWRSAAFPVIRDLAVDRTALDELIRAGGTVDVAAGTAPDADDVAQGHLQAERALDFAACIGCGACVAACPNGAAALFAGAKLAHHGGARAHGRGGAPRREGVHVDRSEEHTSESQIGRAHV